MGQNMGAAVIVDIARGILGQIAGEGREPVADPQHRAAGCTPMPRGRFCAYLNEYSADARADAVHEDPKAARAHELGGAAERALETAGVQPHHVGLDGINGLGKDR